MRELKSERVFYQPKWTHPDGQMSEGNIVNTVEEAEEALRIRKAITGQGNGQFISEFNVKTYSFKE